MCENSTRSKKSLLRALNHTNPYRIFKVGDAPLMNLGPQGLPTVQTHKRRRRQSLARIHECSNGTRKLLQTLGQHASNSRLKGESVASLLYSCH